MIPRKRIDIGWADLGYGCVRCLAPGDREAAQRRLERAWDGGRAGLACLSVRSGFDALLEELAFPAGSEIIVSAVNIRDMARIIHAHGLVAVPVDLDAEQLSVSAAAVEHAATPRSRAVLVAHLFGSRMPMDGIVEAARARGLFVIEDCAQAFAGDAWRGHPDSDVTLFSFGPIKTATALQGGMLGFRDAALCQRVRARQSGWPLQGHAEYLFRVLKYTAYVLLGQPAIFSVFVFLCRACGTDHERVLGSSVRGFAGGNFFRKIRHQPSLPLLALLRRRIERFDRSGVARRTALALRARERMPGVAVPGNGTSFHSYWVFPIRYPDAEKLMRHLWSRGFDATRGASSLCALDPPPGKNAPAQARAMLEQVLYLPVHSGMTDQDIDRLAAAVMEAGALTASA